MWKTLSRNLADFDRSDLLEALGVRPASSNDKLVTGLALFGAGVLVGVGLGLMLAPKSGRELRDDVRERLKRGDGTGASQESSAPVARVS